MNMNTEPISGAMCYWGVEGVDMTIPDGVQDFRDGSGILQSPYDGFSDLPTFFIPDGNTPVLREIATITKYQTIG